MKRGLHRWLGWTLGLWLSWLGLTGSLLVMADWLETASHPALYRVADSPVRSSLQSRRLLAETVSGGAALKRYEPGRPERWTFGGRLVLVDAGACRILGSVEIRDTVKGWVLPLHEKGEPVLGLVALASALVLLTGWLLQPPTWRALRGPWKLSGYELHRRLGWLATPGLLVSLLTGATLVHYKRLDLALRGSLPATPRAAGEGKVGDLDQLLASATRALPSASLVRIDFPSKPGEALSVRLRQPGEWNPKGRSFVYLEPGNGQVLQVDDALADTGPLRWIQGAYPLHAGYYPGGGWLVLLGLCPVTLWCSGLWFRRRRWLLGLVQGKRS